jgi:predicted phage tail component-like protein
MIGAFSFNGVESSTFDMVCKSVKRPLLPAAKTKRIDLPGSSGAYDFDDHEYSLRTITMKVTYLGTSFEELRTRARSIAAWLSTASWGQLIINDEADKYYLAKVTSETDLTTMFEAGEAEITFDCQPFAYSVDESEFSFAATGLTNYEFSNPGTRHIDYHSPYGSESKITIVGTWTTLSLAMNGATLSYDEAATSSTLVIDNVEMTALLGTTNKFSVLSGDIDTFLSIISGSNTLTVNGTGLNVTVTIDFIPMWI